MESARSCRHSENHQKNTGDFDSHPAGAVGGWLGGLLAGAVHEVGGGEAVTGFAVRLMALAGEAPIVWIGDRLDLYPPGLMQSAIDPARLILAEAKDEIDRLAALEIALRGGMHGVVVARAVSRLAARKLALAARCGGGLGLVLRAGAASDSAAFAARWRIEAARSGPGRQGGTRWRAELIYARGRNPGVFLIEAGGHESSSALVLVSEFQRSGDGRRQFGDGPGGRVAGGGAVAA